MIHVNIYEVTLFLANGFKVRSKHLLDKAERAGTEEQRAILKLRHQLMYDVYESLRLTAKAMEEEQILNGS